MPGITSRNKQEIRQKTTMRRKSDFKKLDITISPECFPKSYFDIVAAAFLKLSAEKSPWPEIYRMENLIPH